jgi:SagB-type dehydrogenase family enzyme
MRMKTAAFHAGTLISMLLLVTFAATFIFGLVQVRLGLHQFIYHKYAAYTTIALTAFHLAFNARRFLTRVQCIFRRGKCDALSASESSESQLTPENLATTSAIASHAERRDFLRISLSTAALTMLLMNIPRRLLALGKDPSPDPTSALAIDEEYHLLSKQSLLGIASTRRKREQGEAPPLYKSYPNAKTISLPREFDFKALSVADAINKRRSIRDYTSQPISFQQLSQLLHYANGITERRKMLFAELALRAAPSAGALYDTEIYVVANKVSELASGLYHYNVRDHALELLSAKGLAGDIMRAALSQEFVGRASAVFVLSSVFRRVREKYGNRAYRYCLMGCGHIGENIYLTATALGLGTCAVGAFDDDAVNRLIGVDGTNEAALYMLSVGTR